MAEAYLVCEGQQGSLDNRVLNKLIAQTHKIPVFVSPAGGDRGLRSVRAWLEERSRRYHRGKGGRPNHVVISVEDRNYRSLLIAQATWNDTSSRSLIWLRHEIENYLLEPRVLLCAFNQLRKTVPSSWPQRLPSRVEDVAQLIDGLARPLLLDHAARVLHEELCQVKRAAGVTELGCPEPGSSTARRRMTRDRWLHLLEQEIKTLRQSCTRVANLHQLKDDRISARFDQIFSQVSASGPTQLLRDVGGHEMLTALRRYFQELGAGAISAGDIAEELVTSVEVEYNKGNLFQPDEFADLANRLKTFR